MCEENTIFDHYPFLLANLSYSCLALAALLLGFVALPESRAREALLADDRPRAKLWQGFPQGTTIRRLLLSSSLLFGYTAARLNSFVLVSSLPKSMKGMALTPHQFGSIQVCAALMSVLNQLTLYPVMMRRLGPYRSYALSLGWTLVISLPMPLYYLPQAGSFWNYVPITVWQMLSQLGFSTCFPVSVMLINRECSTEHRGAINGWCSSLNAFSRGLGPPLAGALFGWGVHLETSSWLSGGRYLSFYVNMATALASMALISKVSRSSCS